MGDQTLYSGHQGGIGNQVGSTLIQLEAKGLPAHGEIALPADQLGHLSRFHGTAFYQDRFGDDLVITRSQLNYGPLIDMTRVYMGNQVLI